MTRGEGASVGGGGVRRVGGCVCEWQKPIQVASESPVFCVPHLLGDLRRSPHAQHPHIGGYQGETREGSSHGPALSSTACDAVPARTSPPAPAQWLDPGATSPIVYKSTRAGRIPATAAKARGTSASRSSPFPSSPAPASALAPDSASNSASAPHLAAPRPTESPEAPAELRIPGLGTMPCRREEEEEASEEAEAEEEEEEDSFLLLEQSVTLGGSGEVDRLVAQIGETLQLDASQDSPATPCAPPGPLLRPPAAAAVAAAAVWADKARPPVLPPAPAEAVGPSPPGALRCALRDRSRVRGRAAPYFVAEFAAGHSALPGPCRRGWLRGAVASRRLQQRRWPPASARAHDDDPHRLLQQLVVSGNLIKEAVRRLQRAVAAVAATGPASASGTGGGRSGPGPVAL